LSKDTNHSKFYFGEAKIVPIETRNNRFPTTDLFAIPGHEVISPVKVMEGRITVNPAFGGNALVVEEQITAFVIVKQEMEFPAGVDKLVGDQIVGFVVELAFGDHVAPLQVALLIIR
jgi:hypothetical protein